jgi:hypothetical protein
MMDWGVYIWRVMSFGVKSGPLTYEKIVTKAHTKYLDQFTKIFMDDLIVYIDMETHM